MPFQCRPMLLASSAVMAAGLLTMGGLGTPNPMTTDLKKGVVGMYVVMALGFSLGWGPQTYVVATELPALRLRDMTLQLGFVVNVISKYVVLCPVHLLPYIYLLSQKLICIIQLCRQLHHPLPCRCGICRSKLQGWIHLWCHCGCRVCLHVLFRARVPR